MREPSAAAVAEGSVCVTEVAKDARRTRDGQRAAERVDPARQIRRREGHLWYGRGDFVATPPWLYTIRLTGAGFPPRSAAVSTV